MTGRNAAIVRDSIDAWNSSHDVAVGVDRWFHPEVVYEEDPRWPDSSTYRGRDAVLERLRDLTTVLGEMEIVIDDLTEAPVGRFGFRGAGSGSGAPYEHLWGYVYELRDDKIVHVRAYIDPDEARRAAGLD